MSAGQASRHAYIYMNVMCTFHTIVSVSIIWLSERIICSIHVCHVTYAAQRFLRRMSIIDSAPHSVMRRKTSRRFDLCVSHIASLVIKKSDRTLVPFLSARVHRFPGNGSIASAPMEWQGCCSFSLLTDLPRCLFWNGRTSTRRHKHQISFVDVLKEHGGMNHCIAFVSDWFLRSNTAEEKSDMNARHYRHCISISIIGYLQTCHISRVTCFMTQDPQL